MRKFIVEASTTKRVLPLPFALSTSVEDLEWLAERLADAAAVWRHRGVVSGWVTITEELQGQPNTMPRSWDACGGPGWEDKVPGT